MADHYHLSDDETAHRIRVYRDHDNNAEAAARELNINPTTLRRFLKRASKRGLFIGHQPVMPGCEITKVTSDRQGNVTSITQRPEHDDGPVSVMPETHLLGKMTVNRDAEGRVIQDWVRYEIDDVAREAAMRAAVAAFTSELPRAEPVILNPQIQYSSHLLNQYTVTDLHFGSLSWREETGVDFDLKIAEKMIIDWFEAAIRMSPDSEVAILAQLGDMLHFDGLESVTPTNHHVLDADSRFAKVVRTVIRVLRQIVRMLLQKHKHIHLIMADANHDPASETWLREMFAAFYDDEPRITVDRGAGTYYAYEFGDVSLFYHHGHKRKVKNVDTVFAGKFREIYGRTKFAYGHLGHLHSDELLSTNLMKIERHETLTAPSSFEARGGWISGRSAKVITYHRSYGEVGRLTLTPEMVASDDAPIETGIGGVTL